MNKDAEKKVDKVTVSVYEMPNICACCQKPTSNMKQQKGSSGARHVIEFKWQYPLCKECAAHQRRWRRWRLYSLPLVGIPLGFICNRIYESVESLNYRPDVDSVIGYFLMIIVVLLLHKLLSMLWRKKKPAHSIAYKHPVELTYHPMGTGALKAIGHYEFKFRNQGFAQEFVEQNKEHIITK